MTTFQQIISILGIIIPLLTLLGFGVVTKHFWDDKHEKTKAAQAEEKDRLKKERQDEIREILRAEIQPLCAQMELLEVMKDAITALSRDRMKCSLNFCKKQHFASASDKANWTELYKSYRKLGGNHFKEYVDQWKEEMDKLPTEEEYVQLNAAKTK